MGLFRQIITFPARQPLAFGLGFSCFKTALADLLVQKYIERRTDVDWKRNGAFGLFGLLYLGGVQYALYVPVFRRLFPHAESFATKSLSAKLKDTAGQITMVKQVFLDQCIHHPFMYFPTFYAMKEIVQGGKLEDASKKYKANFKEDVLALWKLWVPATIVNFTFMPMWGRIPFVATTSLFWTCILSYMRGNDVILEKPFPADAIGNQGHAFRMAFSKRAKLKPSKNYLVVTSCGDSRSALTKLSKELAENGNIVRSSAMFVSGQIIVTMVVEACPELVPRVVETLENFQGCQVAINKMIAATHDDDRFECSLHVCGMDRPGILSEVSDFLDAKDIRVESFIQDQIIRQADGNIPVQGAQTEDEEHFIFSLRLVLSSEHNLDLGMLQTALDTFGKTRGLGLTLYPKTEDGKPAAGVWL